MRKTEVKTDKPIYLGFLTLDWSNNNNKKKKMRKFWYRYINEKYSKKAKLIIIDTDSFIIHIKIAILFKDIKY